MNASDKPSRFQFDLAIGGRQVGFVERKRPVLGVRLQKTPRLEPGEAHSFTVEFSVKSAQDVVVAEIGNVRVFD